MCGACVCVVWRGVMRCGACVWCDVVHVCGAMWCMCVWCGACVFGVVHVFVCVYLVYV